MLYYMCYPIPFLDPIPPSLNYITQTNINFWRNWRKVPALCYVFYARFHHHTFNCLFSYEDFESLIKYVIQPTWEFDLP